MTVFHELYAGVGLPALLVYHGEDVRYRSVGPSGTGAWKDLRVLVRESTWETPIDLGISAPGGQPVIIIEVQKADLSCVNEKEDEVTWDEVCYGVRKILQDTPASWHLYCVQNHGK